PYCSRRALSGNYSRAGRRRRCAERSVAPAPRALVAGAETTRWRHRRALSQAPRKGRYDARQIKALCDITPGAAARILASKRPPADFFELAEYSGRRLAKLN